MANLITNKTTCGSCRGMTVRTPAAPRNFPGLLAVRFRIGRYPDFFTSMVARLSSAEFGAMAELTTRDRDDFTLALIDSFAVSLDVLTFYTELLMNETFLATAKERLSLHELAALTGYAPHPGAAAAADLRFTLAEEVGAPASALIPVGTKAESTPAQDETPVIFETIEAVEARPAWNAMRPRRTAPHPLTAVTTTLYFAGADTGIKPGDAVFFHTDIGDAVFALVRGVRVRLADTAADPDDTTLTVVTVQPLSDGPLYTAPLSGQTLSPQTFEPPLEDYLNLEVDAATLVEILADEEIAAPAFFAPLEGSVDSPKEVLVFRTAAPIFGHAAPPLATLPSSLTGQIPIYGTDGGVVVITGFENGPYAGLTDADWADGDLTVLAGGTNRIFLDRPVPEIGADSYVVLRDGADWALFAVEKATEKSLSRFAVTGKSTRLTLDSNTSFASFSIRGTTVFGAAAWMPLAQKPLGGFLTEETTEVDIDTWAPGLAPGRIVMLEGPTRGSQSVPIVSRAEIRDVIHDLSPGRGTTLVLSSAVGLEYHRRTLRISANVARATQGESVFEILGGGDPSRVFQTFATKQGPETHVPAATPSGVLPTLEVRVDKSKWSKVESLIDAGPNDRVYTTRIDPDGITHVGFGDGKTGARPPLGRDNIRATYRKTHGRAGRVAAGQLNILMSQPLGVRGVINPLAAEGGADAESTDAIRENAPLYCRTLERTVSLTDFEDFARAYAGIGKAAAVWLRLKQGGDRVVVTVAGDEGETVPEGGVVHTGLVGAIARSGDPFAKFHVVSHVPRFFKLAVKIKIHDDVLWDEVQKAVEAALRQAFSFEARAFGQPVFLSEVIAAIQGTDGVAAAVVDAFYLETPARKQVLDAKTAVVLADGTLQGAELLILHPGPLDAIEVFE